MNKIPVWIDSDLGLDDVVAILLASMIKQLDIKGISVVAKNSEALNYAFKNARNILSLRQLENINVYKGANKPLVHDEIENKRFPSDSLKDFELAESKTEICNEYPWDKIYEVAKQSDDKLTIITLGPLTNIATMIALHPDATNHIKEINMMGGAIVSGNITPCAEYNVYVDPEAAENVFKSGIKVNMFGLDVTNKTSIDDKYISLINELETKEADLFKKIVNKHPKPMYLHDCCPIVYISNPEIFVGHDCGIFVETQGTISNGKTCADLYTDYKYDDRHCKAFVDLDKDSFMEYIINKFK